MNNVENLKKLSFFQIIKDIKSKSLTDEYTNQIIEKFSNATNDLHIVDYNDLFLIELKNQEEKDNFIKIINWIRNKFNYYPKTYSSTNFGQEVNIDEYLQNGNNLNKLYIPTTWVIYLYNSCNKKKFSKALNESFMIKTNRPLIDYILDNLKTTSRLISHLNFFQLDPDKNLDLLKTINYVSNNNFYNNFETAELIFHYIRSINNNQINKKLIPLLIDFLSQKAELSNMVSLCDDLSYLQKMRFTIDLSLIKSLYEFRILIQKTISQLKELNILEYQDTQLRIIKLDNISFNNFTIIVPKSIDELFQYGDSLKLCLSKEYQYLASIVSGEFNLFFLKKNNHIKYCFYMDKNYSIIEAKGLKNEDVPSDDYNDIFNFIINFKNKDHSLPFM